MNRVTNINKGVIHRFDIVFWLGKYSFDNDGYQNDLIHGVF